MSSPFLIFFIFCICFIYFLKNPKTVGKFAGQYKFVLAAIAVGGVGFMIYHFDILQEINFSQSVKNIDPVKNVDKSQKPSKTYSGTQLFKFYNSNTFPKVGEPQTQTKPMSFSACKETALKTIIGFNGAIPTKEIVNTDLIYMAKVWSNESEILFTCSDSDQQMTIVVSPYL